MESWDIVCQYKRRACQKSPMIGHGMAGKGVHLRGSEQRLGYVHTADRFQKFCDSSRAAHAVQLDVQWPQEHVWALATVACATSIQITIKIIVQLALLTHPLSSAVMLPRPRSICT